MSKVGQRERVTQDRVVREVFEGVLGYEYLGNWERRANNRNLETRYLRDNLRTRYPAALADKAAARFERLVTDDSERLYEHNKQVYRALRYGVSVTPEQGEHKQTVFLIDWAVPTNNHFAVAEEVTVRGKLHNKRPDAVLYVNGIALVVLELKRSTVGLAHGIRQNWDSQQRDYIKPFFATVQLVLAANDTEGLRYGAVGTKERYFLQWKEVTPERHPEQPYLLAQNAYLRRLTATRREPLDKALIQLCHPRRLLEIVHDFVVYDRGIKKLPRHNQYFGVNAAKDYLARREGGIIWHTQGSGKSLTMVWLAKWILENRPDARVLLITDRTELDEQIEKVFRGVGEDKVYRTTSGADLLHRLNTKEKRLLCSLVHKFGGKEEASAKDMGKYVAELRAGLPADFSPKGNFYVFVDECHRSQSGTLREGMQELLPDALFIGFTGTPLLKRDKQTSLEVFGGYIHTYKFDEAVQDGVVLDLKYEARDVEQTLISKAKIDDWFETNTQGLTDYARAELKSRWGTLKKMFSAKSRLSKITIDIMMDLKKRPRLQNGRGNAMLVSDSVYNACRYYKLFQEAGLKECAVVTSYTPNHNKVKGEQTGEGKNENVQKYDIYRQMIADYYDIGKSQAAGRVADFERDVKKLFVEEPAQMKLLIVVDKLLTGFDAPSATYLYIDKSMRDHGLFQAICRVNRLDGDDKEYGYVIDYKDLFQSLDGAISDYTSSAFDAFEKADVESLLENRLDSARQRLDAELEAVKSLCEPVERPKGTLEFIRYFLGDVADKEAMKDTEERRHALYKTVARLVRSHANIATEMERAGYPEDTAYRIAGEVKYYQNIKEEIALAAGEKIDLKRYEPGMRQLIDWYLGAEESKVLNKFDDLSLIEIIVERGEAFKEALPSKLRNDRNAMAEVVENNLRKVIIEEEATNPAYFSKMSDLLDELIQLRRAQTTEYDEYLAQIVALTKQIKQDPSSAGASDYPAQVDSGTRRALYDNLEQDEALSVALDDAIRYVKRDNWRSSTIKSRQVRLKIEEVLREKGIAEPEDVERIFNLVYNQPDYE